MPLLNSPLYVHHSNPNISLNNMGNTVARWLSAFWDWLNLVCLACSAMAAAMGLDIQGLAEAWESNAQLRSRAREHGSLFNHVVDGNPMDVNMRGAEVNDNVLYPLVERLRDAESGEIGMVSIPSLEREKPDAT